jgi:hypothetical protein
MAETPAYQWGDKVGRCIYCGATDDLRDEHIVPYGLNGRWILRKATCKSCADITSLFELEVLRKALFAPRAVLGFRTRRKKERPQSLPLHIDRGYGREELSLPLDKHPGIGVLPRFELPRWLSSRQRKAGIDVVGATVVHFGTVPPVAFAEQHRGSKLEVSVRYEPIAFARLIAKIAYGYCVARFGLEALDESYIRHAILGKDDNLGTWVGSTEGYELKNQPSTGRLTHVVGTDVVHGDIVAYVRLFAWAVPDEYVVIVGPAPDGHQDAGAQNRSYPALAT